MFELELLAVAIWAFLVVYATWYFTSAKCSTPISSDEAVILWKIHRKNAHCGSGGWKEIRRRSKTVGFECGCGYRYMQRRPIILRSPAHPIETQTRFLNRLEKLKKGT